ncbi:MAG TPA: hypothetical protein ENI60_02290 [Candidatus Fraserbacteria bacterium]|nr:hypothetical protein [Candidatus Fraserbacteria bacterium]
MNPQFRALKAQIMRRKRWLNALEIAGDWLGLSLGLSLAYLLASSLGLLPALPSPWWLFPINMAVGLIGWWWGWRRPIDLPTVLLQIDRALGTGELLCSYHEFSGERARVPFSGRLERLVRDLAIDPVAALPLGRRRRRRLSWVVALGFGLTLLASLSSWQLLPSPALFGAAAKDTQHRQERDSVSQANPARPLSAAELQQLGARSEALARQLRISSAPARRQTTVAELSKLYRRLQASEQALWKLPAAAGQADPLAQTQGSSSQQAGAGLSSEQERARRLAEARRAAEALQQALSQLQAQARAGQLSQEELRRKLNQLARQAPNQALRRGLQRAAQAQNLQAQQRLMQQAQQQLQKLINRDNELQRAQHQIAQALLQASQKLAQSGQAPASQPGREGDKPSSGRSERQGQQGAKQGQKQGTGSKAPQGASAAAQQSAGQAGKSGQSGQADQAGAKSSSGHQAGKGAGSKAQDQTTQQLLPTQYQLKIAHDQLPPDVKLQRMMLGKGVPFDAVGSAADNDTLTLRYDFAKVEPLIRARGLPPQMRELIRQYFIAITTEPKSKP